MTRVLSLLCCLVAGAACASSVQPSVERLDASITDAQSQDAVMPDVPHPSFYTDVSIASNTMACNDLFPSIPLRVERVLDRRLSENYAGGEIRNGLYLLRNYIVYQADPPKETPVIYSGQALRIQGATWNWSRINAIRETLDGSSIYRYNCRRTSELDGGHIRCNYTCPTDSAPISPFLRYEVRGDSLILADNTTEYIFERVGEP